MLRLRLSLQHLLLSLPPRTDTRQVAMSIPYGRYPHCSSPPIGRGNTLEDELSEGRWRSEAVAAHEGRGLGNLRLWASRSLDAELADGDGDLSRRTLPDDVVVGTRLLSYLQ